MGGPLRTVNDSRASGVRPVLKFATLVFTGIIAAGAITALSLAALRRDAARFDRQTLARLAKPDALDPVTTGAITYRDSSAAPYFKHVERAGSRP